MQLPIAIWTLGVVCPLVGLCGVLVQPAPKRKWLVVLGLVLTLAVACIALLQTNPPWPPLVFAAVYGLVAALRSPQGGALVERLLALPRRWPRAAFAALLIGGPTTCLLWAMSLPAEDTSAAKHADFREIKVPESRPSGLIAVTDADRPVPLYLSPPPTTTDEQEAKKAAALLPGQVLRTDSVGGRLQLPRLGFRRWPLLD